MNSATRKSLSELNRRFYSAQADAFDASRDHAWPGWERAVQADGSPPPMGPLRVLDVGCGNGRFAEFLAARRGAGSPALDYTGIDQSGALLASARARIDGRDGTRPAWIEADLLQGQPGSSLPPGPFDLVAAFGLLHHVPGQEQRRSLVEALAHRIDNRGRLVFTVWQFATAKRFESRIIPWAEYNGTAQDPIAPDELESGDYLLSFGKRSEPLRYCHHCDDAEFKELVASSGLDLVDDFEADGRSGDLNRYAVLGKS